MKIDKKILICAFLTIMVLICINGVSAQDTIDKNLTTSDAQGGAIGDSDSPDTLEVSDSGEKLGSERTVNSYAELVTACTDAADGDTIILNDGTYEFPSGGTKAITLSSSVGEGSYAKSLTFKGQSKGGVTITSLANSPIFTALDSFNLKLQNLNFESISSSGGIVYANGNGNLDVIDCTFNNCKAGRGVIRTHTSFEGTATIKNVNFFKCEQTASQNAAVALSFCGPGTYNIEKSIIEDSKYSLTGAKIYGVVCIAHASASATIDDLKIKGSNGIKTALIYSTGKTTIKNSEIKDNTVESTRLFYITNTLTIENTVIFGNTLTESDSKLFYNAGSSTTEAHLNLNNNYIAENTADNIYGKSATANTNFVTAETNYWGANYEDTDGAAVSAATGITQTTWANKVGETFKNQPSGETNNLIPTPSSPSQVGDIYVSSIGDDSKDGSTKDNAVQSIKHAVELAQTGTGKIYVIAGAYTVSEKLTSTKALDIECESGIANITSTADQLFENTAGLKLTNINFTSTSTSNGAIVNNGADLTVDKCIFNVNSASGNAIYVTDGDVTIENSLLFNPSGNSLVKADASTATITANNNWWGKNSDLNTNVGVEKWIVMNSTLNSNSRIKSGDYISVDVSFNKLNTGEDYSGSLPAFDVALTSTASELPSQNLAISNHEASIGYTVSQSNVITVSSGSTTFSYPFNMYVAPDEIYVSPSGNDENDGDEAHPFKTIDQAVTLANNGGKIIIKQGTYAIDDTLNIDKDLEITGQGNAIIDGGSQYKLINISEGKTVKIDNVQLANGCDFKNAACAISNYGYLTLTNSLVYSNVRITEIGTGAAVIRNSQYGTSDATLTVDNCKFYQNSAFFGVIYSTKGTTTTIKNSEFYNNDMVKFNKTVNKGLIYSINSNIVIDNSIFRNNVEYGSIIYLESANDNTVTITNSTFNNNELYRFGVIQSRGHITSIKDSIFTKNNAKQTDAQPSIGGGIYVYGGEVNVETSVFMDNKATSEGKDIYVYKGKFTISDSVIVNNDYSLVANDESSPVITADNNWWGKNTPNTQVPVTKWIRMDVLCNDSEIYRGDTIKFNITFNQVTSAGAVSDYAGGLKFEYVPLSILSDGGLNVDLPIVDKKAGFTYTVDSSDKKIYVMSSNAISQFNVKGAVDTIYVSPKGSDNNTGDVSDPVATLTKAIEIAEKGKIIVLEGTYKTPYLGIISKNLTITGKGKVIIDADNNNRILYVGNESTVVLENLILTNGYSSEASDESGALLGNSGNLTVSNCILSNSKSEKNAGAIYNAANLTVIDSQFINNTADKVGGAIFTQYAGINVTPVLTISGSTFTNNTAKGNKNYAGGAVYAQGAEFVTISNTVFDSNKAIDFGGGAVEITVTAKATIDNCKFVNNTANGEAYDQKSDYGGGAISFIGSYADLAETLTVTNSVFEDNSVANNGGGAIYTRYAKVNVSGSVLINNNDAGNVEIYRRTTDINTAQITAEDNWWGSNDDPKAKINGGTISSWATLTVTNSTPITQGANVKITASLKSGNNTVSVERPILIHTNLGDIEGTLTDGEYSTSYAVPSGLKIISATVDSETQVLYVLTTNVTVIADDITGAMGDRLQYTVKLNSSDASVVNVGTVEVYFGDDLVATMAVSNNTASGTVVINKNTGVYDITVKYTDKTREFANNQTVKVLNVTGINNVITPENMKNFFDENGVLYSDVPFDELVVDGTYSNLGVLTINKTIKISGNAKFENTAFKIIADNVELSNLQITLNKTYADNDGAAIYIGADNVVLNNNTIVYDADDNVQSYAISVDVAKNAKITNNNIKYTAKSEGDVETIAVKVVDGDGLVFEDNVLTANIPSVPIGYANWPKVDYLSQALHVEASDDTSIKNNVIDVKYTNAQGSYDTIYAVHVTDSNNVNVTGNKLTLDAHDSGYGLVMDGQNLLVSNNDINVTSEDYYAAGVNINSGSTAVVDGNNISASSKQVAYPVYLDDWGMGGEVNVTNNNIEGDSNTVYGVAVQEAKSVVSGNDIKVSGNYTMGVQAYQTNLTATGNTILSNGSNVGTALSPQSSVPVETTGICAKGGNLNIAGNNIVSTGKTAIDVNQTTGTINNNKLLSAAGKGDAAVNKENSTVTGENNKVSYDIKLTAKDVKMDYKDGSAYRVLVTDGGKPLAGVTVSIKIGSSTYKATTDKNGYAKLNIGLVPKTYTVTTQYLGKSVKSKLVVKQILKSKNTSVKKSAKKLVLQATLKKSNGKAIKKAKVTFKFKGKTYTAKTNSKGVAKVTIKKNVINKLKKGKTYKVKITYISDSITKTVKVKK